MSINSKLTTRTTVFDAKFCIHRDDDCSIKMRTEFEENSFISFDELCEFAQTIKLTDEDKPNYDIIELSFLITNKFHEPLIMQRGEARALIKGISVLFSFTPTQFGINTTITSPQDLLPILKKNYHIYEKCEPKIKFIGIAHNINTKTLTDGTKKEINYYFIIFEAHFSNHHVAPIMSREHDDVAMTHIKWRGLVDEKNSTLIDSLKKKAIDLIILDHVYGNYDPNLSFYHNARFIPENANGELGARLFHRYDVFISHASEDKPFVNPLAEALEKQHGLKVWYDNTTLKEGDRLHEVIKAGITASRYGIIIFSENFFNKRWPYIELEYLIKLTHARKRNVIIPVWCGIKPGEFSKDFEMNTRKRILNYCTPDCNPDDILSIYRSLEDILGITECTTDPQSVAQAIAFHVKSNQKKL